MNEYREALLRRAEAKRRILERRISLKDILKLEEATLEMRNIINWFFFRIYLGLTSVQALLVLWSEILKAVKSILKLVSNQEYEFHQSKQLYQCHVTIGRSYKLPGGKAFIHSLIGGGWNPFWIFPWRKWWLLCRHRCLSSCRSL